MRIDNPIEIAREDLQGATPQSIAKGTVETILAHKLGMALPPYWAKNPVGVSERADFEDVTLNASRTAFIELIRHNALGYPMLFALEIEKPDTGEMWLLPIEPLVSVSGKNVISRRKVAKGTKRGTIKEYWSQDDYTVQIQGSLIDLTNTSNYPAADVDQLRQICEAKQALQVKCPLLDLFDIRKIVIENYEIPFTSGDNAQNFTITAYSDDLFDLLIDESVLK